MTSLDRRALLGCAALCGVAAPILSACSSDRADDEAGDGGSNGGSDRTSSPADSAESGAGLVAVSDVPVGGGIAVSDRGVVVTQPEEGEFKAFSNVCTHQGGAITRVEDGEMVCSLHQSHFDIADGSVVSGPASNALPEVRVEVQGDRVIRA
jgi:nitrite reductase/ring-hydroxylating ferredoxin subunit